MYRGHSVCLTNRVEMCVIDWKWNSTFCGLICCDLCRCRQVPAVPWVVMSTSSQLDYRHTTSDSSRNTSWLGVLHYAGLCDILRIHTVFFTISFSFCLTGLVSVVNPRINLGISSDLGIAIVRATFLWGIWTIANYCTKMFYTAIFTTSGSRHN